MVLIIEGKTVCPVCGGALNEGQAISAFPALISNQADPLYKLNDTAFHERCFAEHPLYQKASVVMHYWEQKTKFRFCQICHNPITDPDDHFIFPYFGNTPISHLSFSQLHRSCLAGWDEINDYIAEIELLNQAETWSGNDLDRVLKDLRDSQA